MQTYKEHELASLFPMMADEDLKELANDIKENGQRAPIYLLENKILDGRNRYKACRLVGVEPKFRDFNGSGDPLTFVISANVHRRHLTESQRAMIAAKLETMRQGRQSAKDATLHVSREQAAKELDVSPRTVATAKKVLKEAAPEDIKAVEQGEKTVTQVARETKQKAEKPKQAVDKTGYPIPSEVLGDWQRAEGFNETLKQLHKIKLLVEKALAESNPLFREITNSTTADLKNALSSLQRLLPHAVCPTCNGRNKNKCTLCKQRGFISKFAFDNWIPVETKKIREAAIK